MKRFAKGAYALHGMRLAALILCIISCKIVTQKLFAITHITTTIDATLSPSMQESINLAIADLTKKEKNTTTNQRPISLNPTLLAEKLRQQFPCIKTITIAHTPSNNAHITAIAHIPKFCINTDKIATENGTLLTKETFLSHITRPLQSIEVSLDENQTQLSPESNACLTDIPATIFDTYNFSWKNASHAWLHDKTYKNFSILFSDESMPNTDILSACAMIKKNLTDREAGKTKSKNRWVADIRFKNQIVVFTQRGG